MPVSSKVIESLTRSIVEAVHPLKIILFGSHAQGKADPDSDIDVLEEDPT